MVKIFYIFLFLMVFNVGMCQVGDDFDVTIQPNVPTEDDDIVIVTSWTIAFFGWINVPGTVTLNGNSVTLVYGYTGCNLNCGSPPPPPGGVFSISAGQLSAGDYDLAVSFVDEFGNVIEVNPISFTVGRGVQSVPTLSHYSIFVLVVLFLILYRMNKKHVRAQTFYRNI